MAITIPLSVFFTNLNCNAHDSQFLFSKYFIIKRDIHPNYQIQLKP